MKFFAGKHEIVFLIIYMGKRKAVIRMKDGRLTAGCVPMGYGEMISAVERLREAYPFLPVGILGRSVRGRLIPILTLGDEDAGDALLYVGAHHGMEWITAAILLRFADEVLKARAAGRVLYPAGDFWERRTVYVVPMLNPDGCDLAVHGLLPDDPLYGELCRMNGGADFFHWQANARGVDLNHNYDAGFLEYKEIEQERSIVPGRTKYSGSAPESEPETAALASFLRFQPRVRAVLTLHTQGEEIYYTSGGVKTPESRRIAGEIARLTGYRLSVPEGTATYGGLTDWCIRSLRLPSFTVECGRGENPLPPSDFFGIYVTLREMLHSLPLLV